MNQIALIFSDIIYITVADDRLSFARQEMLPNRCHSANLYHEKYGITPFEQAFVLFPLNSCGGLGRDVIAYTVDILDLVYYAAGAYLQHLIGNA